MYVITGYEHIKSKEAQVFTKVYISQHISDEKGSKPFPINYMVSGQTTEFVPGTPCNVVLDSNADGKLFISSLTLLVEDGTVLN